MKSFIKLLLCTLCFWIPGFSNISGQDLSNIRTERKHALSVKIGGDQSLIGLSYDVFISPKFNTEYNLSLILPGVGAGFYYHPWGGIPDKNWSPYTGLHLGYKMIPPSGWGDIYHLPSAYIPIGLHYISDGGFHLSLDAGCFVGRGFFTESLVSPSVGLKLGYRFYNTASESKKSNQSYSDRMNRTQSIRSDKRVGISVIALLPAFIPHIGLSVDYYFIPQLNSEAFIATGRLNMAGLGLYYHPWGGEITWNGSPYTGFKAGVISNSDEIGGLFYLPVGVSYFTNKAFFFDVNIGCIMLRTFGKGDPVEAYFASVFKIGYRF